MPTRPPTPPISALNPITAIATLLAELAAAVAAGDSARAWQLSQAILQGLATEAADRASVERQVRALMAELDKTQNPQAPLLLPKLQTEHQLARLEIDAFSLERGLHGIAPGLSPTDGVVYPVWFGTNRKPAADSSTFTGERHNRTTLGRVLVHVPEAHRFGETGSSFWTRLKRLDWRDDRLRVQSLDLREQAAFFEEITAATQAAREAGGQSHALFFLHGFNVSFEDAAIRAAQIGCDLKVPGATAFFSWPSRGTVAAYPADEASIEASEKAITDFLVDFTAKCGADKVHVIAHSMGNRGLLRALQRIAAQAETRGKVKFGQILLAAPDVDRDLFLDLARLYREHSERTTLYASDGDLPVHLSAKLHDAPRAGYFQPYTVAPGIDTVAVPGFDIDLLGHSYFAQAEALLHDIYDLMRHGEAPGNRQRIMAASYGGANFWRLSQ